VPIAGVPIAVRAILALHEAGFRDVALLAPGRPRWAAEPLARRGVPVRWLEGLPDMMPSASRSTDGLTLLLAGDLLVDAAAVRALRGAGRGPVWTAAGQRVGVVCAAADLPACSESIDLGAGWPVHGSTPLEPLREGTRIAAGLAVPLEAPGSTGHLERVLLEHIGDRTTSDSYLATLIDRPLSRPLTRLLLRTSLAPAHVTLLSVAIGLLGAAGLATVSYGGRLGGVLLLLASIVLDCVDGDLARARLAQTAAGARLDVMGDYLVHLAVFLGLATGLWRGGLPPGGVWAALALLGGVVAAMAAVHVLFIRPALRQGGDLHWAGDAESLRGRRGASIAEKLASRDYTYLLLVLAVLGHLEWFLYAAAGGAWVFTAALIAYWVRAMPRQGREAVPR
jgi:phosphatidylglycerophosphate synthase